MLELAHLGMVVKDCEKTSEFYCRYLGCSPVGRWENQEIKAIELLCGSLIIELLQYLPPRTETGNSGTYNHLAFKTDHIEEKIKQLKELGTAFETAAPRELENGKKIIFFRGPEGERIELVQEP